MARDVLIRNKKSLMNIIQSMKSFVFFQLWSDDQHYYIIEPALKKLGVTFFVVILHGTKNTRC